jgi:hypothetical protein
MPRPLFGPNFGKRGTENSHTTTGNCGYGPIMIVLREARKERRQAAVDCEQWDSRTRGLPSALPRTSLTCGGLGRTICA